MEDLFFWREEDYVSARAYKDRAQDLLYLAYRAYRKADAAELARLIDVTMQSSERAWRDPYLISYERTVSLISLLSALCYSAEGKHDTVYQICSTVLMIADDCDKRRAEYGKPPLPASEVRYTVLNVLGDTKWCGDESERNRVMTPEEMCDEWPVIYERAMYYAWEWYRDDRQRIADIKEALGWAGVQVAKTAARFCPDRLCSHITKFNKWYGATLAMADGHYRRNGPLAESPWYYDFEIAKLYLADRLSVEALDHLTKQREALLSTEHASCTTYRKAARREYKVLRSGCVLEVISA